MLLTRSPENFQSSDRKIEYCLPAIEPIVHRAVLLWTLHMTDWYLVWVEGLRGPEPQKWSSEGLWGQMSRQDVIVRFPLSDREAGLSLDQLAKLHPVPPE